MPRVPSYDLPQEAAGALPTVRQSGAPSFGPLPRYDLVEPVARASLTAGIDALETATRMQERRNADMVLRAETTITNDYLGYEQQSLERRGQQAWNLAKDTARWWDDESKKQMDGLENDAQRGAFGRIIGQRRLQSLGRMSSHESDQRRLSLQESAQASIVSSTNLAAANAGSWRGPRAGAPSTPDPVTAAKQDVLRRVQVLSDLNGWTPELRGAKEAEFLTNFHKQVLQSLVDADPGKAKAYFETNKGEIAGSQQAEIGRALTIGGAKAAAQGFADGVVARGLSLPEALTEARRKFEGDAEDAVVNEIKTRFNENEQATNLEQRKAVDQAYEVLARTGSLNEVPSSVLSRVDGKALIELRKEARRVANGEDAPTDWVVYYDQRRRIASDPAYARSVDLRQFFSQLGKTERESLIDLQSKVLDPKEVGDVVTFQQQLSAVHQSLGWGNDDAEQKGRFDQVASQAIAAEQQRSGAKLDQEQRQKILDRLVIEGSIAGTGLGFGLFPKAGRLYKFYDRQQAADFVPKIPRADRDEVVARFTRKYGRAPTDAEVMDVYKRWKGL